LLLHSALRANPIDNEDLETMGMVGFRRSSMDEDEMSGLAAACKLQGVHSHKLLLLCCCCCCRLAHVCLCRCSCPGQFQKGTPACTINWQACVSHWTTGSDPTNPTLPAVTRPTLLLLLPCSSVSLLLLYITAAQANFEKALVLAQSIGERVQERRAVRGLAAACKLQGRYQEAIGYYERVLLISQAMGEFTGRVLSLGS
jgi:tetratricopeptide (TPR) repeat protein